MARRGGLGKGLGALIPPGGTEGGSELGGLDELTLASIRPNRFQPRDHFDEEALALLADSIREVGVLQPVLVRPVDDGESYELIAGERRWRAARRVGLQTIPALVRETDDASALEQALVENLHRDSLNPLEEAAAYQQLIEDFGLTHDDVAARVGRSRATVTNTLRLMQLPPAIQKLLQQGKLSMGHARALLGSPDRAFQEVLAKRIADDDLSVRAVEEAVREHQGDNRPAIPVDGAQEDGTDAARRRLRPPGLLELEELLGDHLETRVKISMGSSRGKVVVEFSTLEDLERIYRLMTDGATARSSARS
ncbi:MAG: ParB family transcriptional regulator, chromosome partitioning protein [Actinomycetota bacterium]|nr:ParB family transcriptional regulator, chromosome partitioning protein [Actinomycetota bacterium]